MTVNRTTRHTELAERFLDAWNTQDVERVLACYTTDVVYRDPNTRGNIEGADALRRYLTKLFAEWQMHWELREPPFSLAGDDGSAVPWRASLRRKGSEQAIVVEGMDLALLEGDLLKRNDVYFDRLALLSALQS
jgi:ketosteroid isomerase-like protein